MKALVLHSFAAFLVALAYYSCANQVAPTGGPQDREPPKVLGSNPLNKSTNFKSDKVRILFDEYVNIENAQQQVVISPPMDPFPDFKIKGKELLITFKDTLRTNTTYTINISAAVKDITEANVLEDYQYVFSTGEYLDSFFISGKIVDAELATPAEGVLVLVYDLLEDSVVYIEKPYYFGRTDKSGLFKINNMKGGQYKVFALKDENFNLKYDLPNEKIAFWPEPILVNDTTMPPFQLRLFQEEAKRLQMIESHTSNRGLNQFVYSLAVENIVVSPVLDTLNFGGGFFEFNATRDTINHWYQFNNNARSIIVVTANDTLTDTITVKAPAFTADSLYKLGKPSLYTGPAAVESKGKRGGTAAPLPTRLELGSPFEFELNRPAQSIDNARVYMLEDTINSVRPRVYFTDSVQRKVAIDYTWKPGSFYKIVFLDSAITDRYGLRNDSLGFELNARKPDEYGAITIVVDSLVPSLQYVLEARIGEGPIVFREVISGQGRFEKKYERLIPGNYKVRIIRDANRNGQWDTGSYMDKLQPERIYIHPNDVALKPNWEMELEIEMDK